MKKILSFLDVWGIRVSTLLVLIVFFKTCNTNSKIDSTKKELQTLTKKVDSLSFELKKEIKVEGLKSEKRMIQSTDRKILDVNRQSEIDKEISELDK